MRIYKNAEPWAAGRECEGQTMKRIFAILIGCALLIGLFGGIIGNTCGEDDYAFIAEGCTYNGAVRGLGNTEYPDI